jgi:excisionase family DNA binding protein
MIDLTEFEMVNVGAVAKVCHMSPNSVYKAIARGEITAKRIGGVWRIPVAWLKTYLASMDNAKV